VIALTFDACGGPGGSVFELANHGTRHLPLSVTGRSAYGIGGTRDAGEVYDEVATNQVKLTRLLGTPRYFRAGTAYSDDVAAQGIATAVPQLTASGYRFVRLSDGLA
jgi:peptidoglycan/xylan/chitin deacetylase (PgdA/CDA1 family)